MPDYLKHHIVITLARRKHRRTWPAVHWVQHGRSNGRLCRYLPGGWRQSGMLSKGNRSQQVTDACHKHGGSIWVVLAVQLRYWRKNMSKAALPGIPGAGYGSGVDDGSGNLPAFILVDDKGNNFFSQFDSNTAAPVALRDIKENEWKRDFN